MNGGFSLKHLVKIISVILCLILAVPCSAGSIAGAFFYNEVHNPASPLSAGQTIVFGRYPTSLVTNEALIGQLSSVAADWRSYGFYEGEGYFANGQMRRSDYAVFCDVEYPADSGFFYRGVKFSKYRPYWTGYTARAENSFQDDNGYELNTEYWFCCEPLKWRVIEPSVGLIVPENIIDSTAFNNVLYNSSAIPEDNDGYLNGTSGSSALASAYSQSSIRQWLNSGSEPAGFSATAFSDAEKELIIDSELNNFGYYTLRKESGHENLDDVSVTDKVFLLSYDEMINSDYDLTDEELRFPDGTDYARCMGLCEDIGSGGVRYRLRSPGAYSYYACNVNRPGVSGEDKASVNNSSVGIRPAIKLNTFTQFSDPVTVKYTSDGTVFACGSFTASEAMPIPAPPQKAGYRFEGWDPAPDEVVPASDVCYDAVWQAETYTAVLMADGVKVGAIDYVYGQKSIDLPAVPKKEGYTGKWESYSLTPGGITIHAIYTPETYIARLVADGKVIKEIEYQYGQKSITLPPVPEKAGYTGEWENYSLTIGGITINAVYTPGIYIARLVVDGQVIKEIEYQYGQKSIQLPPVPEKEGYTGEWESYSLTPGGITINAVYKPIKPPVRITGVRLEDMDLVYLRSGKLTVVISGAESASCTKKFYSSNPDVATVDDNGNVKAKGRGTAIITCKATDENGNSVEGQCTVTVKFRFYQWLIWIFLFGFIWYK